MICSSPIYLYITTLLKIFSKQCEFEIHTVHHTFNKGKGKIYLGQKSINNQHKWLKLLNSSKIKT